MGVECSSLAEMLLMRKVRQLSVQSPSIYRGQDKSENGSQLALEAISRGVIYFSHAANPLSRDRGCRRIGEGRGDGAHYLNLGNRL